MKKRKILLLIPFAGLVLSGCTFQEGWQTTTSWLNNNIWTPVKEFFEGLFGGGEKKKEEEEEDDPKPTPTPTPTPSYPDPEGVEVIGSKEEPISVSEFRTLVDSYIPFDAIDAGKSSTDTDHWYFVEAKVKSSSAFNDYGEVEYLNIYDTEDKSLEVTGHFVLVDESLGDYSAANSLAGKTVVVKGCGCLYNHSTKGKTYQMAKYDNDHKPVVVKVTDPTPSGLDYGTLQKPLTVSQAKALIDAEDPTLQKAYVTGEVKSNDAYDTGYSNVNRITITDGAADLVIFRCGTFPSDVTPTSITSGSLVGKVVVASGTGELYQGTTYELTSPEIHSIEDAPAKTISGIVSAEVPTAVGVDTVIQPSQVKVTVSYEEGGTGFATVTEVVSASTAATGDFTGTCRIEGWNELVTFNYTVTSEAHGSGTESNPYSVAEARAAATSTAASDTYVSGIIYKVQGYNSTYKSLTYWLSDDGTGDSGNKDGLQVYSGKGLNGADFSSVNDLSVGDSVVVKGDLKIFTQSGQADTYELDKNNVLISRVVPTVDDITISGQAKTEYLEGANVSYTGLTVTATLSNGVTLDVTEKATWTYNGETTLAASNTTVRIEATYGGISKYVDVEITVTQPSGDSTTVEFSVATYCPANNISSGTKVSSMTVDSNVTATASGTDANTGKVYQSNQDTSLWEWRFYGSGKGNLTISIASGYVLDSVVVGKATSNYGTPSDFTMEIANNQAYYSPESNFNIKTIVVVYHAA